MGETLKLNHIRFMSDDKPVCYFPARLDLMNDPVMNLATKDGERSCKECTQLLLAHNVKQALNDNDRYGISYVPAYAEYHPNQFSPIRGLIFGMLFASILWVLIVGGVLLVRSF